MKKIEKILIIISLILIIAGVVVTATIGLRADLHYAESKTINIYIGKDFEKEDIRKISKEVFKNQQVIVQDIEMFNDTVAITVKDVTEEQRQSLNEKINSKYELENTVDDLVITTNPHQQLKSLIIPFIGPVAISLVLIIIFVAIRYRKLCFIKEVLRQIITLALLEGSLFGILAIFRIPIGNWIMAVVLSLCVLSMFFVSVNQEKRLETLRMEPEKKKKEKTK